MSLDLTFLPVNEGFTLVNSKHIFSHSVIQVGVNYLWFEDLAIFADREGVDVPATFTSYLSRDDKYEDAHYGVTDQDPYGSKLKMLQVRQLIAWQKVNAKNLSPRTKAAWAYIKHLKPDVYVVLYWS